MGGYIVGLLITAILGGHKTRPYVHQEGRDFHPTLTPGRVSPDTTISNRASALVTAVSAGRPPMGWGAMAMGRSGMPRERRSTLPRRWKRWLHTVTVGMPRRSSSTASWILHEVQEPQSPRPTTATSTVAAISSMTRGSAGMEAVGLRR